jgi:hypothetical protein
MATTAKAVTIKEPNFQTAEFEIVGTAPLVIHRFSAKTKLQMKDKMETGKAASSKKNRDPKSTDEIFEESRYYSADGWDGFHAGAIRAGMIRACSLVNFKMTLAKLSVFVVQDGWDAQESQVPLIKITDAATGKPAVAVKQEDMARVETGQPYVTVRAAYHNWGAKLKIRWDADQFGIDDIANLLRRVGLQIGLCEGRPNSKNSCGMGWGTFDLKRG